MNIFCCCLKNGKVDQSTRLKEPPQNPAEQALWEVFQQFDKNGDGVIDKSELGVLLVDHLNLVKRPTDRQLARIMNKVDMTGQGGIRFEDFKTMMSERNDTMKQYKRLFRDFDTDGDGAISRAEMGQTLKQGNPDLTESEIDIMFQDADEGEST